MKKSLGLKKSLTVFFLIVMFGALVSSYVALKRKCEDLRKQIAEASDELRNQDNLNLSLYAEYQRLTAEERIMNIAEKELDMVIADPPIMIINIDQNKINSLQSLITDFNE